MTKFKICGLRNANHAIAAAKLGADFLGFVFVPEVRRQVSVQQAKTIVQSYRSVNGNGGPKLVGLFANQTPEQVNSICEYSSLDIAQLCGNESPEYWRQIRVPIIKQIRVKELGSRESTVTDVLCKVEEVVNNGHIALLDNYEKGTLGGTGRCFDWSVAREISEHHDFLLAGGLSPDNVHQAIIESHPWGVDVSSGVETKGIKDPKKIAAFARSVSFSK